MNALLADLRYSARRLWKTPVFTIIVVVMLALGLGINSTLFLLFNAILLRPLPGIDDPGTVVMIGRTLEGRGFTTFTYPDFRDYRDRNQVFSAMSAISSSEFSLAVTGGSTERVIGEMVNAEFFPLLGVQPPHGRLFLASDDSPTAETTVVLSHAYWKRRFAGDLAVVGSKIMLNGHPATVIGIAGSEFRGVFLPTAMDLWVPIGLQPRLIPRTNLLNDRKSSWHRVIARLKPSVSVLQAQANVTAMARQLQEAYPDSNRDRGHRVAAYSAFGSPRGRGEATTFLGVLTAVTSLVLIVVCANVANLMLARASSRRREIAIRVALGAGRVRIIRQVLTEGLILATAGALGSLVLGLWGSEFLIKFFPGDHGLPVTVDLSPDWRVLGYTALLAIGSALAFGLLPALQTARPEVTPALKAGEAAVLPRGSRLRGALTIVQVALCLVLLTGAGLLIRSVQLLKSIDPRMNTGNLLLVSASPEILGYKPADARRFYSNVLERLASAPGVTSATAAHIIPFTGSGLGFGPIYGGTLTKDKAIRADCNVVGPDYFTTLGIPLHRGRDFLRSDLENSQKVVVINETLARQLWPTAEALGQQLFLAAHAADTRTVVGVAADSRYRGATEPERPFYYVPITQSSIASLSFHVRTASNPMGVLSMVRSAVAAVDPNMPLYDIRTMQTIVDESFWPQRLSGTLAGASGLLGVLMASLGLYGVLAYHVAQRTREIGLRMALGASSSTILGDVLRGGMKLSILGLLIGIGLAFAATRILTSLLYGVTPTDALTFLGASALLLTTTCAACWIPARRATRIDPIIALRYE